MIHFSLRCSHEHLFDEWFMNSAEYETKAATGGLTCPTCGDTSVTKALMAPSLGGSSASQAEAPSCGMGGGFGGCAGGMCGMGHSH